MRYGARCAAVLGALSRDPRALAIVSVSVIVFVYHLPCELNLGWFIPALLLALRPWPGRALWLIAIAAALWTTGSIHLHQDRIWPASHTGEVHRVSGRVVGLPEKMRWRTRFRLISDNGRNMRLSWYQNAPDLQPGDCVDVRAKLKTPHGSANPGLFDYEAWLWRKNIDATGYVKTSLGCDRDPLLTLDRVRKRLRDHLRDALGNDPMTGIIEALTLGVRGDITNAQWRVLRQTGTTHLVAISGLHIGLIAGWLFFMMRWLALRLRPGRWADWAAVITALAGATGYASLAGWALPTERALIMVAAALIGALAFRGLERSRLLALAAIMVVALWPAAVLAPGFWLSFGAVTWLLYLIRPSGNRRRWRQAMFVQCGLVAGLMPLTLWFFGQASLIAPLVNAVAIPAAVFFVPAVLVASATTWLLPPVGVPLVQLTAWILGKGWLVLAWMAGLPGASVHLAVPGLAALGLAVLGLVWLFTPRGIPARWLGLVFLCPALVGWQPVDHKIPAGAFVLTVLDVGQGSANIIRTAHHRLVFDAGPAYAGGFDAGRAIVVPFLRNKGIDRLDALILSHDDRDHTGGAGAIRQALDVRMSRGALSNHPCRAGQHWRWDQVRFRFVYPDVAEARRATTDNARSCMLRVSAASGKRTLLTGDIEAPEERALVERGPDLAADVLVVPHHGSNTSSPGFFLDAVQPRIAIISSGWHNRWGFPAPDVIRRLRARHAQIVNTATEGAITVRVGNELSLRRWRAEHRHVWQRPRWPVPYNSPS